MEEPTEDEVRDGHGGAARRAGRIVALDGLRGVAVLLVVFDHTYQALDIRTRGVSTLTSFLHDTDLGVLIFFVLSGACGGPPGRPGGPAAAPDTGRPEAVGGPRRDSGDDRPDLQWAMIAILDYGLGNVRSISNMLREAGVPSVLATAEAQVRGCDGAILPGVGSFDTGMRRLNSSGLRPPLENLVADGRPLLGICLGMHMLGTAARKVTRRACSSSMRRPSGSDPTVAWPSRTWDGPRSCRLGRACSFPMCLKSSASTSCTRSRSGSASDDDVPARAEYGQEVTAAVGRRNVRGVQFHPEKSHRFGLELLRRWATAA